jgi:hypothetical protein
MSFVYFLSKFSSEAMAIELFFIGLICSIWFGYLIYKKRKYGAAQKNIPDDVVRAFLVELLSLTEGYKNQLFGETEKLNATKITTQFLGQLQETIQNNASAAGIDVSEITNLRNQLNAALQKQNELTSSLSALSQAKAALEAELAKLKNQASADSNNSNSGDNKELLEKIKLLEARLKEYEVIEDDLANLKKYMQENKELKEKLAALTQGSPQVASASESKTISNNTIDSNHVEESTIDTTKTESPVESLDINSISPQELDSLVNQVEESIITPTETVLDSTTEKPTTPALEEANENQITEPVQTKTQEEPGQKEQQATQPATSDPNIDLLSEFEKMVQ